VEKRAILDSDIAAKFEMKKHINGVTDPVESPIVRALSNLYAECSYVVIYVMYAPAGQGKTA
jgi:hypothetical protein